MVTHSSILAWEIPQIEEPHRLQSMGHKRVGHDLMAKQRHVSCWETSSQGGLNRVGQVGRGALPTSFLHSSASPDLPCWIFLGHLATTFIFGLAFHWLERSVRILSKYLLKCHLISRESGLHKALRVTQ